MSRVGGFLFILAKIQLFFPLNLANEVFCWLKDILTLKNVKIPLNVFGAFGRSDLRDGG